MNDQTSQPGVKSKKVFDIMPPGKTAPTSTSRPVIVTNQPEQEDTMLAKSTERPAQQIPEEEAEETSFPVDQEQEDTAAEESVQDGRTENSIQSEQVENEAPAEQVVPEEESATQSEQGESGSEAGPETESEAHQHVENAPSEIVVAHHSKPAATKRNLIILIVVIIILLVAAVDLMLDAQILKSSLPHTHFLKQ